MIIYTVMVLQISDGHNCHWVDRSFLSEEHALEYIAKRNSELTPRMLDLYECDSMEYYLQWTILEDCQ